MKPEELLKLLANALGIKSDPKAKRNSEGSMPAEEPKAMSVDDFVAMESNPFTEGDKAALQSMSPEAFAAVAAAFAPPSEKEEEVAEVEDTEEEMNEEETDDMTKKNAAVLSAEDKEALAFARSFTKNHRDDLVKKITGNSDMKAADLATFNLAQLQSIANGLRAPIEPNFGLRALANANSVEDEDAKAMANASVVDVIKARAKK